MKYFQDPFKVRTPRSRKETSRDRTSAQNLLLELAVVTTVGFGLAKVTQAIPVLNDNKMFTRTLLYTFGYVVAISRPDGGYKLISGN